MKLLKFKLITGFPYTVALAAIFTAFAGCARFNDFPPVPVIEFEHYEKFQYDGRDTGLILTVSFEHGTGMMGLESADSTPPYHRHDTNPYQHNFFIEYYEKIDNEFAQIHPLIGNFPDESKPFVNFNSRFPNISTSDRKQPVYGEIKRIISIDELIPVYSDTIRFRIWIVDRELNHSNKVWSPEIVYKP